VDQLMTLQKPALHILLSAQREVPKENCMRENKSNKRKWTYNIYFAASCTSQTYKTMYA